MKDFLFWTILMVSCVTLGMSLGWLFSPDPYLKSDCGESFIMEHGGSTRLFRCVPVTRESDD